MQGEKGYLVQYETNYRMLCAQLEVKGFDIKGKTAMEFEHAYQLVKASEKPNT